jgi:hypothetical protein
LRIAATVSNARAVLDSFFGLSVIVELLEVDHIIGVPLPARGRTQSEHEELLAVGLHARSSKVDVH